VHGAGGGLGGNLTNLSVFDKTAARATRAELERGGGSDARAVLVTGDCTPPRALNPRLSI